MRWPRLKRRGRRENAPPQIEHGFAPGSWSQPAAPVLPPTVDPATVPTGNVEIVATPVAAPPPSAPTVPPPLVSPPPAAVLPTPVQPEPPAQQPLAPESPADTGDSTGVRLGFADGSDLHLDPKDPHSLALKAVADLLLHRGPHRRVS